MSREDALAFIDEAIEALAVESYSSPARPEHPGDEPEWSPLPAIQSTQAIHLERVDSAIGPTGESMFYDIAERIKQAMAALHGARNALNSRT